MKPEEFVDSTGYRYQICYGLCRCNVWPIVYDTGFPYTTARYGSCKGCGEKPELLDPHLFSRDEAEEVFRERYGRPSWHQEIT